MMRGWLSVICFGVALAATLVSAENYIRQY